MTTIFSLGPLYIGIDDEKFNDIQIHLGKLRIEYGGVHKEHGPSTSPTDRQEDGKVDESNQPPTSL